MTEQPDWYIELRRQHGPWGPMPRFSLFFMHYRDPGPLGDYDVRTREERWSHMWWDVACMHYHRSRAELGLF